MVNETQSKEVFMEKALKAKYSSRGKTIMLALTAIFTSLIIAGAFIKIPIPEVPCTMQMFFVQLACSLLGWGWGSLAVALYLFMGLIGIPVFTKGGGFAYVLQPTFGYLIGFLIGTICGGLVIKAFKKKNIWAYMAGAFTNLAITYVCGMLYFYLIKTFYFGDNVTAQTIFISLFLLLIPGDIVFSVISAVIATKLKPILDKTIYQTASTKEVEEYEKANETNIITYETSDICANNDNQIEDTSKVNEN